MLTLISPAKNQNYKPQQHVAAYSLPVFLKKTSELVEFLREYSAAELSRLLGVNTKMANENATRYAQWHTPFTVQNAKQALFAYNGEVYRGISAETLEEDDINYMQTNLRILSGFYGILRPLDLIQPYRLEAKTKLRTKTGENLYTFWLESITNEVKKALNNSDNPSVLANLASIEYSKMIDRRKIKTRIIEFDFLQYYADNNVYKPVSVYLKKARGLMARYIAQNKISDPEELKGFNTEGYWFNENLSDTDKFVFVR